MHGVIAAAADADAVQGVRGTAENVAEDDPLEDIIFALLDALQDPCDAALAVSINCAMNHVAKQHFCLAVEAWSAYVLVRVRSTDHNLRLLNMLCRLFDGLEEEPSLSEDLASRLAQHLFQQMRTGIRAAGEVLVELAPLFPALVFKGVLSLFDEEPPRPVSTDSSTSDPGIFCFSPGLWLATAICQKNVKQLHSEMGEILVRIMPLLSAALTQEARNDLCSCLCSICLSRVVASTGKDMNPEDEKFPQVYAEAARRGHENDKQLGIAYSMLLSSWTPTPLVLKTLSYLSHLIPTELFVQNLYSVLHLFFAVIQEPAETKEKQQGLSLFLLAALSSDDAVANLMTELPTLVAALLQWVGPTEGVDINQILPVLEIVARAFPVFFVESLASRQHVNAKREDKLMALRVAAHLPHVWSEEYKPALVRHLAALGANAADDFIVTIFYIETTMAYAQADYFDHDAVSDERTQLLCDIVRLATLTDDEVDTEQSASYFFPLSSRASRRITRSKYNEDLSLRVVRTRAAYALKTLATIPSLIPSLWQLLVHELQAGVPDPSRLVPLCSTMTEICAKGPHVPARALNSTSAVILVHLLLALHVPTTAIACLDCLEATSSYIHPTLGSIWGLVHAPPEDTGADLPHMTPNMYRDSRKSRLATLHNIINSAAQADVPLGTWFLAVAQEVAFVLHCVPRFDELAHKMVDALDAVRRDTPFYRAASYNLLGVALSNVADVGKVLSVLEGLRMDAEFHSTLLVRKTCAQAIGRTASTHFSLAINFVRNSLKNAEQVADKNMGFFAQKPKSAEYDKRAILSLALGYCALYAPSTQMLLKNVREYILTPLESALTTKENPPELQESVIEAVTLTANALTQNKATNASVQDTFLPARDEDEPPVAAAELDAGLGYHRDCLLRALLPFLRRDYNDRLVSCALTAMSALVALPAELPSDLYAAILDESLQVLIVSIPDSLCDETGSKEALQRTPPQLAERQEAVTACIKSLLFHAHTWLGVSRLLQAVYAAGADCPVEFIRRTCTQLLQVLCAVSPILDIKQGDCDGLGDWCECLALLLPRTGDSSEQIATMACDAVQNLLSRCEWTHKCSVSPSPEEDPSSLIAPPAQRLAGILVRSLPPQAIPPLVQHLMPAMHDHDSKAALCASDALYLILQACSERLAPVKARHLISTVFNEVEMVTTGAHVRQRVLSCIRVLATTHFENAVAELLACGPNFLESQISALQILATEKHLLLKLLNFLTDTINNNDPGTPTEPNRLVLSATCGLGHLFQVDDSSLRLVVKKFFPQLFATFLLRLVVAGLHERAGGEHIIAPTLTALEHLFRASQNEGLVEGLKSWKNELVSSATSAAALNVVHSAIEADECVSALVALFMRVHNAKQLSAIVVDFVTPFLARTRTAGHRVGAMAALAILGDDVEPFLQGVKDPHPLVRKQAVRGMERMLQENKCSQVDHVIQHLLVALDDTSDAVVAMAIRAVTRAYALSRDNPRLVPILLPSFAALSKAFSRPMVCEAALSCAARLCSLSLRLADESRHLLPQFKNDLRSVAAVLLVFLGVPEREEAARGCLRMAAPLLCLDEHLALRLLEQQDFETLIFGLAPLLTFDDIENDVTVLRGFVHETPEHAFACGLVAAAILHVVTAHDVAKARYFYDICNDFVALMVQEASNKVVIAKVLGLFRDIRGKTA